MSDRDKRIMQGLALAFTLSVTLWIIIGLTIRLIWRLFG